VRRVGMLAVGRRATGARGVYVGRRAKASQDDHDVPIGSDAHDFVSLTSVGKHISLFLSLSVDHFAGLACIPRKEYLHMVLTI
jgi:hypothetical protein